MKALLKWIIFLTKLPSLCEGNMIHCARTQKYITLSWKENYLKIHIKPLKQESKLRTRERVVNWKGPSLSQQDSGTLIPSTGWFCSASGSASSLAPMLWHQSSKTGTILFWHLINSDLTIVPTNGREAYFAIFYVNEIFCISEIQRILVPLPGQIYIPNASVAYHMRWKTKTHRQLRKTAKKHMKYAHH